MTMTARVIYSEEKVGKSGPLLLVTWERTFESSGEAVIVEEQDIVYRGASKSLHEDGTVVQHPEELGWPWSTNMKIEPTLLFRFSALTYNAHRIHYDRDYARGVEGYPGLVVHGPLQAMALADMLRHRLPDMSVSSFEFRSVRPVFDETTLRLRAKPHGNEVKMAVLDVQGRIAMRASAKLDG
jgi:3-methylfumaryl-CoA hydratase